MAAWLARLADIFERDPLIDEYALVPQASPFLFGGDGDEDQGCMALEHKLAISLEAALVIYRKAGAELRVEGAAPPRLASASRAALLCSADAAGAWAQREALLAAGELEIEGELRFGAMLLRTNHKSGETWAYRRHVLALALAVAAPERAAELAARELELVEEVAKKYDHHYYAWNHWAWLERLCKDALPNAACTGPAASLLGGSFPRLARVTPSHYGLFHHRVVRLRERMLYSAGDVAFDGEFAHGATQASSPSGLPDASLDAFAAERELSSSLLETFPHLEAPWAFRLQLFATLLDAAEAAVGAAVGAPGAAAVKHALDLWRADTAAAAAREDGASAVPRLARRFRAHALQELAEHLQLWRRCGNAETASACTAAARECLEALEGLEAVHAVARGVLRGIRLDLEDCERGQEGGD